MMIAIITGASSGMGREAAVQIAERFPGLDEMWIIARREGPLRKLKEELPVPARIFCLDLTDEGSLESLRQALKETKPQIRFLVNAAGYGRRGPVGSGDLKEETGMVRLNCEALCAVTHLVLPYMAERGRILQFASAAAFLPQPGFGIYAASKAFVLSYSLALHQELKKRGITVTAVCPGPVDTEFFQTKGMEGPVPFYKKLVMAKPRKVVRAAIFDSVRGETVSVYGLWMKGFRLLCKVFPVSWLPGSGR